MNDKMNLILEGLHEQRELDEAEWKTMHGAHILIDNSGNIVAGGGNAGKRKKLNKSAVNAVAAAADKKNKKSKTTFTGKKSTIKELHKNMVGRMDDKDDDYIMSEDERDDMLGNIEHYLNIGDLTYDQFDKLEKAIDYDNGKTTIGDVRKALNEV